MNKYFLSVISILLLFQSFKVADELFFHKEETKRSYVIIADEQEIIDEIVETEEVVTKADVDVNALLVTANLENGKKIIVRVNDRGPFADNRIIDLSFAAASVLGFVNKGTAKVRVTSYIFKDEKVNNHAFEGIIEDDTISKFYIQLAAFKDLSGAKVFKNKLSKININTSISFDDMFYRIQIGPLKNDELSEAISILEINNLSDFIVIKN